MASTPHAPYHRAGALLVAFVIALGAAKQAVGQVQGSRYAEKMRIPGAQEVVVVAEGDFEPRSVGSYALRIYSGVPARFPTDRFITGVIRPRDGTIESVRFADLDSDGRAEILVVMRSVGTGGYLAADAFSFSGASLRLIADVAGLDKGADPVDALRDKVSGNQTEHSR